MASVPEPRTDSGDRPNTGPGAPCFCGCGQTIPERKAGSKRRTRKSAEFIDDSHRMAYHRGSKPLARPARREHVVAYPGEHFDAAYWRRVLLGEVRPPVYARRQALSRRSLLETGARSVRDLIVAWYRQNPSAEVVELHLPRGGPVEEMAAA